MPIWAFVQQYWDDKKREELEESLLLLVVGWVIHSWGVNRRATLAFPTLRLIICVLNTQLAALLAGCGHLYGFTWNASITLVLTAWRSWSYFAIEIITLQREQNKGCILSRHLLMTDTTEEKRREKETGTPLLSSNLGLWWLVKPAGSGL